MKQYQEGQDRHPCTSENYSSWIVNAPHAIGSCFLLFQSPYHPLSLWKEKKKCWVVSVYFNMSTVNSDVGKVWGNYLETRCCSLWQGRGRSENLLGWSSSGPKDKQRLPSLSSAKKVCLPQEDKKPGQGRHLLIRELSNFPCLHLIPFFDVTLKVSWGYCDLTQSLSDLEFMDKWNLKIIKEN